MQMPNLNLMDALAHGMQFILVVLMILTILFSFIFLLRGFFRILFSVSKEDFTYNEKRHTAKNERAKAERVEGFETKRWFR